MKIAMMGSGGVGGFIGGRLAHAGYDVSFVARGAHLAAMRERGLVIESDAHGDIRIPSVRATDDPASLGAVDLILLWWKLGGTGAAIRPTTTAMRATMGPIRKNPRTRAFLLEIFREVVAVGRAQGIALPADYADACLARADGLPEDMVASMAHDLQRGNRLEVEWLSGGVVQLGAAAGVPTPANRAVWDILALYADGGKPG